MLSFVSAGAYFPPQDGDDNGHDRTDDETDRKSCRHRLPLPTLLIRPDDFRHGPFSCKTDLILKRTP